MPIPLPIPQGAVAWNGNYQSFKTTLRDKPPEGDRVIPVSIGWGNTNDGGPNNAVQINCRLQRAQNPITQISALFVDNLLNGTDVQIVFPDTQFKLDIPNYSSGLYPVITNDLSFYVASPVASSNDATYLQVMNFYPPPETIAKFEFSSVATQSGLAIPLAPGTVSATMITGNGVLTAAKVSVANVTATALSAVNVWLSHNPPAGSQNILFDSFSVLSGTTLTHLDLFQLPSGMNFRFTGNLVLNAQLVSGTLTSGIVVANVFYRGL